MKAVLTIIFLLFSIIELSGQTILTFYRGATGQFVLMESPYSDYGAVIILEPICDNNLKESKKVVFGYIDESTTIIIGGRTEKVSKEMLDFFTGKEFTIIGKIEWNLSEKYNARCLELNIVLKDF